MGGRGRDVGGQLSRRGEGGRGEGRLGQRLRTVAQRVETELQLDGVSLQQAEAEQPGVNFRLWDGEQVAELQDALGL